MQFELRAGGPEGFSYAVVDQGKIICWASNEDQVQHIAWSLAFREMLEEAGHREFLDLIFEFLARLRRE